MGLKILILKDVVSASANCGLFSELMCVWATIHLYRMATKYKNVPKDRPFGTFNLIFAVLWRSYTTSPIQLCIQLKSFILL
jgi:hypothetical protein